MPLLRARPATVCLFLCYCCHGNMLYHYSYWEVCRLNAGAFLLLSICKLAPGRISCFLTVSQWQHAIHFRETSPSYEHASVLLLSHISEFLNPIENSKMHLCVYIYEGVRQAYFFCLWLQGEFWRVLQKLPQQKKAASISNFKSQPKEGEVLFRFSFGRGKLITAKFEIQISATSTSCYLSWEHHFAWNYDLAQS